MTLEDALMAHRLAFDPEIHVDVFKAHQAAVQAVQAGALQQLASKPEDQPTLVPAFFTSHEEQGPFFFIADEAQGKGLI